MKIAPPRLFAAAFTGFLLWVGFAAAPARAEDLARSDYACPVVLPRFEIKAGPRPSAEAARFAGGASLRGLVATPCTRAAKQVEV